MERIVRVVLFLALGLVGLEDVDLHQQLAGLKPPLRLAVLYPEPALPPPPAPPPPPPPPLEDYSGRFGDVKGMP